jgi:hypothetical protein
MSQNKSFIPLSCSVRYFGHSCAKVTSLGRHNYQKSSNWTCKLWYKIKLKEKTYTNFLIKLGCFICFFPTLTINIKWKICWGIWIKELTLDMNSLTNYSLSGWLVSIHYANRSWSPFWNTWYLLKYILRNITICIPSWLLSK